jgi:hypothetical protein
VEEDRHEIYQPDAEDLTRLPDLPARIRGSVHTIAVEAESVQRMHKVGRYRHFTIQCDEPPGLGGDDAHPQPLFYLAAAVAF